jgi:hypothetical protein
MSRLYESLRLQSYVGFATELDLILPQSQPILAKRARISISHLGFQMVSVCVSLLIS